MLRKAVLGKFVWSRLKTLSEVKYRSFMSIVGGRDIFVLYSNLKGSWVKKVK